LIIKHGFTLCATGMSVISTIQFTQDHVRTLTGVSVEAVRHWRKTVTYLSTKTGKVARFSFTDVVGLAVTSEIVNSLGVHIGTVSSGIDALFRLLNQISPASLDSATVLVTGTDAVLYREDGRSLSIATPALIVPLAPFVAKIRHQMMPTAMGPYSATQPSSQKMRRKA
jgi:hypothetical protein